uniref:Uncharacterized protein n=1 Tax=Oryza sativa subsp. japonica TaxID=39947 RepID=Q7XCV5_ORYSJ|nr:hypothetical protein LOC_Os10g37010 [Oryza sativa Japonica Group]
MARQAVAASGWSTRPASWAMRSRLASTSAAATMARQAAAVRKRDTEVRYGKARYHHGIALPIRESVTVLRVKWARRFELAVSLLGYTISTRYRVSTERERHVVPIWE